MKIMIILILVSICVAAAFLMLFLWAVRTGQYEDDVTPSVRILLDDQSPDENIDAHSTSGIRNK